MKSSRKLFLSAEARADVRDIRRFTARTWGTQQRDRYLVLLYEAMQSLLEFPEFGRARDEFFPGCRSLVMEQHVAYYHLTDDAIVIDRLLHRNQDAAAVVR